MKKELWLERRAMPPLPYHALCLSERDYRKALAYLKVPVAPEWVAPGADAMTHFLTSRSGEDCALVCLNISRKISYEEVAALLVHEGVHIWQHYRDAVIREPKPCGELEAYVIQRITLNLLDAYRKQRRR